MRRYHGIKSRDLFADKPFATPASMPVFSTAAVIWSNAWATIITTEGTPCWKYRLCDDILFWKIQNYFLSFEKSRPWHYPSISILDFSFLLPTIADGNCDSISYNMVLISHGQQNTYGAFIMFTINLILFECEIEVVVCSCIFSLPEQVIECGLVTFRLSQGGLCRLHMSHRGAHYFFCHQKILPLMTHK